MIEVNNLHKKYGNLVVLKDISLNVKKGKFLVILGENGCGKSTFLRIISGIEKPTKGRVLLSGDVGFVFQEPALFPWRNVEENIGFGLEIKKNKKKKEIIEKYIKLFNLCGFEKYYPRDLSGGMKQKVVLARTLALNPDIILMDEPFANIDFKMKKIIETEILKILKEEEKTIVFVTHDIKEALFLADKIVLFTNKPAENLKEFDNVDDIKKKSILEEKIKSVFYKEAK
jgi:NitT/TauT family transport system ATP-binding protein